MPCGTRWNSIGGSWIRLGKRNETVTRCKNILWCSRSKDRKILVTPSHLLILLFHFESAGITPVETTKHIQFHCSEPRVDYPSLEAVQEYFQPNLDLKWFETVPSCWCLLFQAQADMAAEFPQLFFQQRSVTEQPMKFLPPKRLDIVGSFLLLGLVGSDLFGWRGSALGWTMSNIWTPFWDKQDRDPWIGLLMVNLQVYSIRDFWMRSLEMENLSECPSMSFYVLLCPSHIFSSKKAGNLQQNRFLGGCGNGDAFRDLQIKGAGCRCQRESMGVCVS